MPAVECALEEHLSPQEIAARLRIHENTVYSLIHAGKFRRVVRLGRKSWRVPASSVTAYLRTRQVTE